jgi:branched-chain amino acid transport system ATP-binding protein
MRLRLEEAHAGYADTTVLRGIDFTVTSGEVAALLGPNGAGKSTLLRVLTGLVPLSAGRLYIDEVPVTAPTVQSLARRGVCHITEGRSIFDALTVRENIRLFSPRHREAASLDRATLAFPILGRRLNQVAGTLSGGEQQMLALSRAYVCGPKIVLIDEASLGIAPVVLDEIFRFLSVLARDQVGLLIVEQYVQRALAIAQRAYVMARGALVFDGSAEELGRETAFDHYLGAAART